MNSALENLDARSKVSLLKSLLQKKLGQNDGYHNLSYGQKGLWFLQQQNNQALFNQGFAMRLHSSPDVKLMKAVFQKIIDRHASLRSVFVVKDGEPVIRILPEQEVAFRVSDVSTSGEKEVHDMVQVSHKASFDLAGGPLFRVHLFIHHSYSLLLINTHHIVTDGISLMIILDEFKELYTAALQQLPYNLIPLKTDYNYFVNHQSELLNSTRGEELWHFWKNQLSGELPLLSLPEDKKRPVFQTYNGTTFRFSFDEIQTKKIKAFSKKNKITLYTFLLSAFQLLLNKYSGQEDILIGSPVANRNFTNATQLVGCFVNLVVMRGLLLSKQTVLELLQNTHKTVLDGLAHQEYPFSLLVEKLQVVRDPARHPLFQVCFILNSARSLESGMLEMEPYELSSEEDQFDLIFEAIERKDMISCSFKYNQDLYDESTIIRMTGHLHFLIGTMMADTTVELSAISLVTEAEQTQIVEVFNNTSSVYPRNSTIHDQFRQQVLRTPLAAALVCDEGSYTYAELDAASDRLSFHLTQHYGVIRGELVGLYADRSMPMLVSILAILKSGAGYVPLDKNYPISRIRYMATDTALRLLLCDEVIELPGVTVLNILEMNVTEDHPQQVGDGENVAYVMYTSGTTGQPKGVPVMHRSVLRLVMNTNYVTFTDRDHLLQTGSLSFDASTFEIWGMLLNGGCLHFCNRLTLENTSLLKATLLSRGITMVWFTASWLHQLIDEDVTLFAALKTVLAGGDKLSAKHVNILKRHYPELEVINGYGPTENTTFSLCYPVKSVFEDNIPIGRPISNSRVYIMDDQQRLLPIGIPGEICVGGDGLSGGYLNQPEQTAYRFIPDPYLEGGRLYRTGDKGRWQPDGTVLFMGRQDNQLKIRGYRVEPGEIEYALKQHTEIKDALVILVGDQELAAYIVTEEGVSVHSLRDYFSFYLPDYMLPAHWVLLSAFPLTANGKIDRSQLPGVILTGGRGFEKAVTTLECSLAGLWEDILDVRPVGIRDNFFELGGHSLKAMKIVTHLHKMYGVQISIKQFFGDPTIAGLADMLSAEGISRYTGIPAVEESETYALSHAQRRLWILDQMEENQVAYNIPLACILNGYLNKVAFNYALQMLVTRHESLRTIFTTVNGEPVQKIIDGPASLINIIYLEPATDEEVRKIANEEVLRPFQLEKGPLMRVQLLRLEDQKHLFLLTMHHIIADGWSIDILVRELVTIYNAYLNNERIVLPRLNIHYKDYAAWQNAMPDKIRLQQQQAYWLEQFADAVPVMELPADFKRPAIKTYNGDSIRIVLDHFTSEKIHQLSLDHKVSTFMFLLASVNTLLYRYTSQEDIVIGTPVAARDHFDLENQVGYYANTLAVRNRFSGADSFAVLLQQIKTTLLQAYEYQQYPFDKLVDDLQLERDMSRSPLFDVMVVLENMEGIDRGLSEMVGLKIETYEADLTVSKFDLNFMFRELPDHRITLLLQYNTDLFTRARMERMLEHYGNLLSGIIHDIDQRLSYLPLLGAAEQQQWNQVFNNTLRPYSDTATLHGLFEARATVCPEQVALRQDGISLSYRDLNKRANQLAHYLLSQGVSNGDNIGLLCSRSFDMITGMLGILKAGCAYVPVDPLYPVDRQYYIINHSDVRLVIRDVAYPLFDEYPEIRYTDVHAVSGFSTDNPAVEKNNEELAYTIYTSGSTGRPKGVMIAHCAAVNLVEWVNNTFSVGVSDRLLFITSMCFDLSVYDIFGMLAAGGTIVIARQEEIEQVHVLQSLLKNENITFWDSVPSTMNYLVGELEGESGWEQHSLRLVFMSGDWIPVSLPGRLQRYFPNALTISLGGATEGTVWSNYYVVDDVTDNSRSSIPYGRPISNNFFYILDEHQQLVPQGVTGELYIGGVGVAAGYANDPEKSAAAFMADPFHPSPWGRMYKTGDLGRMDASWNMEFIGRRDHQVKIRGYRVELGEIRNMLLQHPGVQSVEVIARGEKQKELLLYYTASTDILEISLREFLSSRLPDYMLPHYFIRLEKFPLTSNGKIDYKSLPSPEPGDVQRGNTYIAPEGEIEQLLSEIWSSVLNVALVGRSDSFFDLGGDSIRAIQISSRLYKAGYKLEVRSVFQHPQIMTLASQVSLLEVIADQGIVSGSVPLTPIQRWFFGVPRNNYHHFNQAVLLHSEKRLNASWLTQVLAKLQLHHDGLRMRYKDQDGYNAGTDYPVYLESYDLRKEPDALMTYVNALHQSIDLSTGPLLKIGHYQLSDGDRLLLVSHHLVIDGVSWRILFEDLLSLYGQLEAGQALVLPLKTTSYKSWAEGLSVYNAETERGYWNKINNTPVDVLPRNPTPLSLKEQVFSLSASATSLLLSRVHHAYGTDIDTLLLTGLGYCLQQVFGMNVIRLMLEGHGRESILKDVDVSRTVGWFTSMYPVILDMHHGADAGRQLKEIKESQHGIPNRGIGYGILGYTSTDIDIRFNYMGQFDNALSDGFKIAAESAGQMQPLDAAQDYALEVSGVIRSGCLEMTISYNGNEYDEATMAQLATAYQDALEMLIDHCISIKGRQISPSDLTYKQLSIDQVDQLNSQQMLEDVYLLSPMQESMYFHSLLEAQSAAYFEQLSFEVNISLDLSRVSDSLKAVWEKFEVLRTNFNHALTGQALQFVWKDKAPAFSFIDISDVERQQHFIDNYKEKDKQAGFDLSNDMLMRVCLLKTNEDQYTFIWSFHHILMDGWCLRLIAQTFFDIYGAQETGKISPPPPYKKYIEWLDKQDGQTARGYWKYYLENYAQKATIPVVSLLTDATYSNEEITFELDTSLSADLNKMASRQGVTLNVAILTVWGILLSRYNNVKDVVFGRVVSGRPAEIEDVENIVGLFINTVPVRVKYDAGENIETVFRNIQQELFEGEPYHHLPLPDIQQQSTLRQQLLDHIFVFENYISLDDQHSSGEFKLNNIQSFEQTNYNFNIIVVPGEKILFKFKFNGVIYDAACMHELKEQLVHVLHQVTLDQKISPDKLTLLTAKKEKQILDVFNNTSTVYPRNSTIHDTFREQVLKTPAALALVCEEGSYTYAELDTASDQLSNHLVNNYGVARGELVGLYADRSMPMLVSILAILKSGAGYVPLDKSYPITRIRYMTSDTALRLLLCDEDVDLPGVTLLNILEMNVPEVYPYEVICKAEDVAYVMYTSGTTGHPKGVPVMHRSVLRLVMNTNYVTFTDRDHLLQTGSLSFDASTFEIWGMLLNGGCLHFCSRTKLENIVLLKETLLSRGITMVWFTASWLHQLIDEDVTLFAALKTVLAGGDKLSAKHVNILKYHYPELEVINGYGPTENTTFSLCYPVKSVFEDNIPIGRPISNSRVYIMDDQQRLLPIGIPGEICVGGDGLSGGYLHQPEQTAYRFIADPYLEGGRLYRTGDKGRWQPDGTVLFMGRQDNQLKIRGYRVEPGEIEYVLKQHDSIKDALVMAVGDQELAAYIVSEEGLSANSLRDYFALHLPDYMLPAHWVQLSSFPLTANGKVDRSQLPAVVITAGQDFEEAVTELECALVSLWEDILDVRPVGIRDNFFELGGHSLKAMKIVTHLHKMYGVQIPLKQFFGDPTIVGLAATLSGRGVNSYEGIPVIPESETYALSHAQRRLWILDQMEEDQVAYNIPLACVFTGVIDVEIFEKSFQSLIGHHESLRTRFVTVNGEPRQQVLPDVAGDFRIQFTDLRYITNRQKEAADIAGREAARGFNLLKESLIRVQLLQLEEDEYLFLLTMHHIISDGWSVDILVRELVTIYNAYLNNERIVLPRLNIHYKEYAAWQNAMLTGEDLQSRQAYWQEQFKDGVPVLELPADFKRPAIKTYKGENISFSFGEELVKLMRKKGLENQASVFNMLLASVNTLLYRYTGQEDIVIGTPVAARDHFDLENQVGYYANTLAVRSRFSGEDSFAQLLQQIKTTLLQAYEHQQYPFDKLVDDLQLERDMSRSPLFDVMVVLENKSGIDQHLQLMQGITSVADYERTLEISKFDLNFMFVESATDITLYLEYNTDLFTRVRMERMLEHYGNLLSGIIHDIDQRLSYLPLLGAAEQQQWNQVFNNTLNPYSDTATLHGLFEARATVCPEQVALRQDGISLSYRDLNKRANQLAHYLLSQGVSNGDNIGLLCSRSFDMITGMLGILKAGCAYVPVDPLYPVDRQYYIINHSGVQLVIRDMAYPLFDEYPEIRYTDVHAVSGFSTDNPAVEKNNEELAYTIYTSGSTGRPKGVMIAHCAAVNLVEWVNNTFSVGVSDRLLFITSMCFDLSVYDIFGMLAAGGTIVIARQEEIEQVHVLQSLLKNENITFWDSVPSTMNYLVGELEGESGWEQHSLRLVFMSGDWIPVSLPGRLQRYFPNALTISLGGATEGTVWSNYYVVDDVTDNSRSSIPYGRPISNNFFYILDEHQQLVPQGVTGELYIGGVGVAAGYANDPEKSAAAFMADPFHPSPWGRMYKTGDLGRMDASWNMEFIGRRDHQVKIRGYRVELGEIRNMLLQHPGVQSVEVIARGEKQKELLLYYTASTDILEISLREFLSARLPDYMLPHYFIRLEKFPLTSNGKIDYKSLPSPEPGDVQRVNTYIAPEGEIEQLLSEIWSSVLNVALVGRSDSFFDLGGDSIRAIQISSRLYKAGYKLEVRSVFQHPQIMTLASQVSLLEVIADQGIVSGSVPLTPIQRWFFGVPRNNYHHFNQAVLLHSEKRLNADWLTQVLAKLQLHHDGLRMRYKDQDGYNADADYPVYLESYDLRKEPDALMTYVNALHQSIDLSTGPLLKIGHYQLSDGDRLLLVSHHLVIDGVSWRILFEDLLSLYGQLEAGQALVLPLKTTSYKSWAEGLSVYNAETERVYWNKISNTAVDMLPRNHMPLSLKEQVFSLSASATSLLLSRVHHAYGTDIDTLLLTGLGYCLQRVFGMNVMRLMLEGHGRESILKDVDVSRTVGWFTSMYPVILDMHHGSDAGRQLKEIKESQHGIPNRGIGYGILGYTNSDIDIRFNYLGQFDNALSDGFKIAAESAGQMQPIDAAQDYALEVSGVIRSGCLEMTISYNGNEYDEATMAQLATAYQDALEMLIDHCLTIKERQITPSDIKFKDLSIQELENFFD